MVEVIEDSVFCRGTKYVRARQSFHKSWIYCSGCIRLWFRFPCIFNNILLQCALLIPNWVTFLTTSSRYEKGVASTLAWIKYYDRKFRLAFMVYQKRLRGQVTPLFHAPILTFTQLDLAALSYQLWALSFLCFWLPFALSFQLSALSFLRLAPRALGHPYLIIRASDKALHFVLLGMICYLASVKKWPIPYFYFRQFWITV